MSLTNNSFLNHSPLPCFFCFISILPSCYPRYSSQTRIWRWWCMYIAYHYPILSTPSLPSSLPSPQCRPSPSTTDAIPSKTEQPEIRSRAKTFGSARQTPSSSSSSSSSSGPRTLRDYQQLSARSMRSQAKSPDENESEGGM